MVLVHNQKRDGASVVELAVVLPFLLFLLVIGADFARYFYYQIAVETAARQGAEWAAADAPTLRRESGYPDVTTAALAASPNLSPTPTVTSTGPTSINVSGKTYQVYQVTVSMPFTTITNFSWPGMGVPKTSTITRTIEIRQLPASTS